MMDSRNVREKKEADWRRLVRELKQWKPLLLMLLMGGLLLLWPEGQEDTMPPEHPASTVRSDQLEEQEERLESMLEQIQGVGRVRVMLSLAASGKKILADSGGTEPETVILSAGTGREETVTVQEESPRYQGALIVCQGGADPKVCWEVMGAVRAVTGLEADHISICPGMEEGS